MKIEYTVASGNKVLMNIDKINTKLFVRDYMYVKDRLNYIHNIENIFWEYKNKLEQANRKFNWCEKTEAENRLVESVIDVVFEILEENTRGLDCFADDTDDVKIKKVK